MTGKKIKILAILSVVITFLASIDAKASLTAEEVIKKAASVINDSKSITVDFSLSSNGQSTKGVVKSMGKKFAMTLPEVSTWYNGKDLYTYNPRIKETTVVVPTAQELLESNPLLYVKGGAGGYIYSFSTEKQNGKYIVDLKPRSKKSTFEKLTITIDSKTFKTEKIVVKMSNNQTVINVTSFRIGEKLPDSDFEYPKAKYPKVEIVDLR